MYDEFNGSGDGGQDTYTQPTGPEPQQNAYNGQEMNTQYAGENQQNGYYQQSTSAQQGTYTSDAYQNYSAYNTVQQEPEGTPGFGIASLVLGVLALITFCTLCMNIPLAILAIIFAIVQLVKGNGKGLAIGGLITSVLSIIACIIFYLVIGASASKFSDFQEKYPSLFEDVEKYNYNYDLNDDDNTDFDYDYNLQDHDTF